MNSVPNSGLREATPALSQSDIVELARYQANADRLARARPTPPPERRRLGPGGDWIELSEAEAEEPRQPLDTRPHRNADLPPAPAWIAAGAVLVVMSRLFEEEPSSKEEVGVPLDAMLREILAGLLDNDRSYRDGIDELAGSNERRANETKALRDELAELKLENARARALVAELKSQVSELAFVSERLRIEARGPAGERGPMGRDGRDGAQGPQGPKGSRGQRGFETTGWLVNEAEYCITPLFYDNSQGPTLNLRGLFEQFNRDTEDDDVAFESERAALSRAAVELEAERVRLGLPGR